MSDQVPGVLQYGSRDTLRSGWGPWWFKPSRRSITLLFAVIGTAVWLGQRHEPWKLVTTVAAWPTAPSKTSIYQMSSSHTLFVPNDKWVTIDPSFGLRVWNTRSGELLWAVNGSPAFGRWTSIALSPNGSVIGVARGESGLIQYYDLAGGRMIGQRTLNKTGQITLGAHGDISIENNETVSIANIFDPDNSNIQTFPRPNGFYGGNCWAGPVLVTDAQPLSISSAMEPASYRFWHTAPLREFSSDELLALLNADDTTTLAGNPQWSRYVRHLGKSEVALVNDGRLLFRADVFFSTDCRLNVAQNYFPNTPHVLSRGANSHAKTIYDLRTLSTLAILHGDADRPVGNTISDNGQSIITLDQSGFYRLWHKVNFECPESPLGVLGMPHAWLLILAFILYIASRYKDASASRPWTLRSPPTTVVILLLAIGSAGSAKILLDLCIGHVAIDPSPMLILCGLGLATGSRAWRLASMVALAASFPALARATIQLRHVGFFATTPHQILDRVWNVPHRPILISIFAATIMAFLAIARLTAEWFRRGN